VLEACVLSLNGAICLRDRMEGSLSDPASLGKLLAARLLAAGVDKILETIRNSGGAH